MDKRGPFRFELFTVQEGRDAFVAFDPEQRGVKAIEDDVAAAMDAAGCRRVGGTQVYLPGNMRARLWCAHEGLLAKYQARHIPGLPRFCGGAVGYAGYDVVRYSEHLPNAPEDDRKIPDMAFAANMRRAHRSQLDVNKRSSRTFGEVS